MIIEIGAFEYRLKDKELYLNLDHDISDPIEEGIRENVVQGAPITVQGVTKNVTFRYVNSTPLRKDVYEVIYESESDIDVRLLFLVKWTIADSRKRWKLT